jgi:hypothetical protein
MGGLKGSFLCILLFCVLLLSCLKVDDHITMNSDGSGTLELLLQAPASSPSAQWSAQKGFLGQSGLHAILDTLPGLQIVQDTSWIIGENAMQTITIEFDSVGAFYAPALSHVNPFIGTIAYTSQADTFYYARRIDLDSAQGDLGVDPFFKGIFRNLYTGTEWSFRVSLPGDPLDSLGNGQVKGRLIKWRFSLHDVLSSPIEMKAYSVQTFVSAFVRKHMITAVLVGAAFILFILGFLKIRSSLKG